MGWPRNLRRWWPLALLALVGGAGLVLAQLAEGERGVAPIDSSSSYEVTGIAVDVSARTAEAARLGGWREAQRRGWKMLWGRAHGVPAASAPGLPDSTLDSIVAGIVVENESIGPTRYVARLGVLFDRARTGQMLGVQGQAARSAPMLVIPVMWSGGAPQTFEARTEWQKAWARFRAGASPVDYVRPVGSGVDPLLLNVAQSRRRGRSWWRMLLDQYGAADVVVPEVMLTRLWPGGPVAGRFFARHGPDAQLLDSFTLRAASSDDLPQMLDEGVRRIDEIYSAALRSGALQPDPSLVIEEPVPTELLDSSLAEDPLADVMAGLSATPYTLQVDTPDAAAVGQVEAALRAVPGVRSAGVTSLALGGVSLLRLTFDGDLAALRVAVTARGWRIEEAGTTLRLRRQGLPVPPEDEPAR